LQYHSKDPRASNITFWKRTLFVNVSVVINEQNTFRDKNWCRYREIANVGEADVDKIKYT